MLNFKKSDSPTFKLSSVAIITMMLLLTSCFRDAVKQEEKADSSSNDFKVVALSGTSKTLTASKEWSIPTAKMYDFRACLRTRITNAQLGPGNKFIIARPDKSVFYADTDKNGCINWQESVPFNFTSDSKYVELPRNIRGNDLYKGAIEVKIGVNPWGEFRGEPGSEVVYLDEQKIPESHLVSGHNSHLALTGLYEKSSGQDLLIDDQPQTEIREIKYADKGRLIRFTTKIRPFIEPFDISGDLKPYYFKKGKFRVYPQVIANYLGPEGKDKMIVLDLMPEDLSMTRNGILHYQKEIKLAREVTMGELQLAIKVEAINSPVPLNDYQGLHSIGKYEQLFGQHAPSQIQGVYAGKVFNYVDFVTNTGNFEDFKKRKMAFDHNPMRFKEIGIRFVRVAPGETATRRTIIYRSQTQVVDTITGAPVRKQPFRIRKSLTEKIERRTNLSGEQEEVVYTDDDGILKWTDEISHLFYVAEQFYYPEIELTHLNSNYSETLKLAINPWNSGWTFGTDIRGREEFYLNMNKTEKRDSLFMIDAFRYQTIRFRYEIDEFMTLNVKKAVVMALDPLTQRYTIEEGRKGGEDLRDGIYLVKIALVKYYIDPFKTGTKLFKDEDKVHRIAQTKENDETKKGRYVTVVKKLLRVQGGRITTPIEFSMRDLRMMSIRSNIMVQIETVDEQRLLRDNLMDRKLRQLVDDYNHYNTEGMSDDEKDAFINTTEMLYDAEREKLATAMERELADLQRHRLKLADAEAERYRALYEFEDKIKDQDSLHDRRARRLEILKMNQQDFTDYVTEVRSNLDQMEKKFSDHWRQWNDDMGIPSNEIQDWENWDTELQNKPIRDNGQYVNPDKERIGLGQNKSVYDYLASMQLFMKDYGLPDDIGENDLKAMRLNNYTQNPAAPFIDLDLYRNNAGLQRRTFIGPCTLIANDNLSELRPTDTIDEKYCDRIDCSQNLINFGFQVDNSVFEESAYHGSIKPFAMLHVDNILEIYKEYERDYYEGMQSLSQLGEFLETYNHDYVSLHNNWFTPKPQRFKDGCKPEEQDLDSELDPDRLKPCYEIAWDNIISTKKFNKRLEKVGSESLLLEFFKYQFYNTDKPEESRVNTLPTLLEKTEETVSELTEDAQEAIFGGTIREVVRQVFTNDADKNRYLRMFEADKLAAFDRSALVDLMKSKEKNLSLLQTVKLCGILSHEIAAELEEKNLLKTQYVRAGSPRTKPDEVAATIREKCLKAIDFNPSTGEVKNPLLSFDRRYRVLETGTYQHIEGKNLNLNVGYEFAVEEGKVINTSTGLSINGSVSPLDKVPFVSAGMSASSDIGKTEFNQIARGSAVSAATFLVVQQATMEIELRKFERCFTSSMMPEMFNEFQAKDLTIKEGHQVGDADILKTLTKGIMVCEGRYNEKPEKVIENYYYLTQHFTAGDMLDDGNLLNHVWLLPLRGTPDFNKFMTLINAKPINKDGEVIAEEDRFSYPNIRLRTNYNQVLPSFPGMYTVQDLK
jgi:hypothetical protein